MAKNFINLELDKIEEEQISFIQPEIVNKVAILPDEFVSSDLFQQMSGVSKHNISGLIRKVETCMNNAKGSIFNISDFVQECHDNYVKLDNFFITATNGVTTSSAANSVIGNMSTLDYIQMDFEIPNSKVRLDYTFEFHPVIREEISLFSSTPSGKSNEEETL